MENKSNTYISIFVKEGFSYSKYIPVIITFNSVEEKDDFLNSSNQKFLLKGTMKYTPEAVYGNLTNEGLNILNKSEGVKNVFSYGLFIEGKNAPFSANQLNIVFNGKEKNDLIATTSFNNDSTISVTENQEFKKYFQEELDNITKKFDEIENISFYWSIYGRGAGLTITYKTGLSNEDKIKILMELKTVLNQKWYTLGTSESMFYEIIS